MLTRAPGNLRSRALFFAGLAILYLLYSKFSASSKLSYLPTYPTKYKKYSNTDLKRQEEARARRILDDIRLVEGEKPKFVLFKQHEALDFDQQAQQVLLHHALALFFDFFLSRVYIYQPFHLKSRSKDVPLSTFLLGATENRAVPSSLIEDLCPNSNEVVHIKIEASHKDFWETVNHALSQKDSKCIFVDNDILSSSYLSSPAAIDIWRAYQHYLPRYFRWSPPILDIVERSLSHLNLRPQFSSLKGQPYMAVHLRRDDFLDHCKTAVQSGAGFSNWANLPFILSQTLPPRLDTANTTSVMNHCHPPLSRILDAINYQVRRKPYIRAIHIIHDGASSSEIRKLETELKSNERAERAGWSYGPMESVTHSGMVPYQAGEKDFLVAVDLEMARRAETFVGNGYSTLTSFIIGLRMGGDVVSAGIPDDITLL